MLRIIFGPVRDETKGLTGLGEISTLSALSLLWDRTGCTGEMSKGRWENELNGLTELSMSTH